MSFSGTRAAGVHSGNFDRFWGVRTGPSKGGKNRRNWLDTGKGHWHNPPQFTGFHNTGKEGQSRVSSERSSSFGTETVFRGSGARGRLDIVDNKRRFFTRLGKEEMMRNATLSLIPVFMVAFSISAFAQAERDVKTGGAGREETLKVRINGGWDVAWAHYERDAAEIATLGTQIFPQSFMAGTFHLDLHASLQDNIDIHVRVQNLRTVGNQAKGAFGGLDGAGVVGGEILPLGQPMGQFATITELYASIREVIDPAITVTIGLQDYVWDPTGSGQAMLLALGKSESLWLNVSTFGSILGVARGEQGFAGVRVDYARDKFALTVGLLQANGAVFFPPNLGASISEKERVFFVNANFDVTEDGSRVGVIAALFVGNGAFSGSGKKDQILTLGGGARVHVATDIDVFGELYFQSGTFNDSTGGDAGGMMFRAGGHIAFPGSTPAWVEVSYISVSGADAASDAPDSNNFFSYENDDDMVIFSSNEWGMDNDRNYVMIKVKAGVSLSTGGGTNNLVLIGKFAMVTAHDDADYGGEDGWGSEFNATVEYLFNKNAKIYFTLAYLFGSDLFESFSTRSTDSGYMFLFGTKADF